MVTEQKRTFAKPVDWDQLYPGRFIKAGDLLGKKVTLTITDVALDELEGDAGKKVKGVMSFKETERQLALNRTNGVCIKAMFGRKLPEWIGKRVTIFPGQWNGDDCIRVWGSPDIEKDAEIVVELPRRKPIKMTMHRVEKKDTAPPIDPAAEMARAAAGDSLALT